jgi:hypothetical protein
LLSFDPRLGGMTQANPYGKPAAFPKIWQVGKPMITIFLTQTDLSPFVAHVGSCRYTEHIFFVFTLW